MKFIKKNLLNIYLIINIMYIFISSILFTYKIISYGFYGYTMIYTFIINFIVSIILIVKKKFKLEVYDILLIIISLLLIISCVFAKNKTLAIYGFIYRYEGIFALLYYLSLLLMVY